MPPKESEVICPACDKNISLKCGNNESRQLTTLEHQAKQLGCSIECPHCREVFIYKIRSDEKDPS